MAWGSRTFGMGTKDRAIGPRRWWSSGGAVSLAGGEASLVYLSSRRVRRSDVSMHSLSVRRHEGHVLELARPPRNFLPVRAVEPPVLPEFAVGRAVLPTPTFLDVLLEA